MKLKAAYVAMEQRKQLEEGKSKKQEEQIYEQRAFEEMERARCLQEQAEMEKERRRQEAQMQGKQVLEDQIREREMARQAAFEEFLREKAQIDDIVRKIREEEER